MNITPCVVVFFGYGLVFSPGLIGWSFTLVLIVFTTPVMRDINIRPNPVAMPALFLSHHKTLLF